MTLPNPYPSSPTRPSVAAIWFQVRDKFFEIHTFAEFYAARNWLDQITKGYKPNWQSDEEFHIIGKHHTLRIKSPWLTELMEYKLSSSEKKYQPEYCWQAIINKIRTFDEEIPCPPLSRTTSSQPEEPSEPEPKPSKVAPRHKTQKPSPSGTITVAQLCSEINLAPNKGRNLLRKAKIEKPKAGWTFKTDDPILTMIREVLSKR